MHTLLIVRDATMAADLSELLEGRGCSVDAVRHAHDGLTGIERDTYDIAFVQIDGVADLDAIRAVRHVSHADLVLVAIVGTELAGAALSAGATDFIRPPAPRVALEARLTVLARGVERRRKTHWHGVPLAGALQVAGDAIEITGEDYTILYVNPTFTKVLGYTQEEAIGRFPNDLFASGAHPPEFFQEIDRRLNAGATWSGVVVSRRKDGSLAKLDCCFAAVFDSNGKLTHRVGVKRDITDRVARERKLEETNVELERARDAALEASQAKSAFLANMSHELRTPLNAIIGYSEMLREDAVDEQREELGADLARIEKSGRHLLRLINDVLDISKIEAGKMQLDLEDFHVPGVVDEVAATIEPQVVKAGNRFLLECPDEVGKMRADATKLRQCLLNLLSNANKFTERGTVHLKVAREGFWVSFRVTDSGIGIDAAAQEKLFQPFVQADSSTTRRFGGTGLGLAISQRFAQMMAGEIQVKSVVGEGSSFIMRLPLKVPERPSRPRRLEDLEPELVDAPTSNERGD